MADKIRSKTVCPGCQSLCLSELWHGENNKIYESLDCVKCGVVWGRVNGGPHWHILMNLGDEQSHAKADSTKR